MMVLLQAQFHAHQLILPLVEVRTMEIHKALPYLVHPQQTSTKVDPMMASLSIRLRVLWSRSLKAVRMMDFL